MSELALTSAQRQALRVLADGELHETAASSITSRIHRVTAQSLARRKMATRHFCAPDGREISAEERDNYGSYEWRLAFRITDLGREALRVHTGGER